MSTTTGYTGSSYAQGVAEHAEATGVGDRCRNELTRAVGSNPSGALLTAFGAGLGVGLAVALTIALPQPKPKRRSMPEELGQRVLAALQEMLPDSIASRIG